MRGFFRLHFSSTYEIVLPWSLGMSTVMGARMGLFFLVLVGRHFAVQNKPFPMVHVGLDNTAFCFIPLVYGSKLVPEDILVKLI